MPLAAELTNAMPYYKSQVFRLESSTLGNPCQHSRANLLASMEGKYEVRPIGSGKHPMRTPCFALDVPADTQ